MLNDIRRYAYIASQDKESESNIMLKELKKAESKVEEINISVKSLYKDKVTGEISEKFFYNLLEDFENELKIVKIPLLYFVKA